MGSFPPEFRELLASDFPVFSIGIHYYDFENRKIILKDLIHAITLKEEVDFQIYMEADYFTIFYGYSYKGEVMEDTFSNVRLIYTGKKLYVNPDTLYSMYLIFGEPPTSSNKYFMIYRLVNYHPTDIMNIYRYLNYGQTYFLFPDLLIPNVSGRSARPIPQYCFVPIGELGILKYKLNGNKIDYDFYSTHYFYYGIFGTMFLGPVFLYPSKHPFIDLDDNETILVRGNVPLYYNHYSSYFDTRLLGLTSGNKLLHRIIIR